MPKSPICGCSNRRRRVSRGWLQQYCDWLNAKLLKLIDHEKALFLAGQNQRLRE
jgi:hypothetical protein